MTTAVAVLTTAYRGKLDQICADAIDLARASVTEDVAGPHIEAVAEGERLVTHYFECTMAGYRGWRWAVTVARTSRSKQVTICETCLLPGPEALTTPDWVPWNERVQPGDLGVGDLMPTSADDDRLVPGYLLSEDPAVDDVVWELGLGRVRVMSREGRLDAADRWYAGDAGPQAPIATAAPVDARCVSCGFFLPLAGAMHGLFGACANVYAPDDGRVVANDHGCGAHSEVLIEQVVEIDEAPTIYDDAEVEPVTDLAVEAVTAVSAVAEEAIVAESAVAIVPDADSVAAGIVDVEIAPVVDAVVTIEPETDAPDVLDGWPEDIAQLIDSAELDAVENDIDAGVIEVDEVDGVDGVDLEALVVESVDLESPTIDEAVAAVDDADRSATLDSIDADLASFEVPDAVSEPADVIEPDDMIEDVRGEGVQVEDAGAEDIQVEDVLVEEPQAVEERIGEPDVQDSGPAAEAADETSETI